MFRAHGLTAMHRELCRSSARPTKPLKSLLCPHCPYSARHVDAMGKHVSLHDTDPPYFVCSFPGCFFHTVEWLSFACHLSSHPYLCVSMMCPSHWLRWLLIAVVFTAAPASTATLATSQQQTSCSTATTSMHTSVFKA